MTDSEKLVQIAERMPEVYKAGQNSMVDESTIIEKTVTGTGAVFLDDVSEIPHDISVKLSSDTITDFSEVTVRVGNANLIPFPYASTSNTNNGITWTVNADGTITANGTATAMSTFSLIKTSYLEAAKDYAPVTFSGCPAGGSNSTYYILGVTTGHTDTGNGHTYGSEFKGSYLKFEIRILSGYTANNLVFRPMVNYGETALPYVPYEASTHIPAADGTVTGVKSITRSMTFFADNTVDISVDYHKSYGMQSEYDNFWDSCQNGKGSPQNYSTSFGTLWTEESFRPKYDIVPTEAYMMFRGSRMRIDLVEHLKRLGVKLDFSKATGTQYIFQNSYFTRVGVVDVTASTGSMYLDNVFAGCRSLVTIDKVILPSTGSKTFGNAFGYCTALENITIEGVIPQSIDFKHSPLTPASMKSIITHLANYANTDNEGKYTVTFTEACWTALEADSSAPDGGTWEAYVNNVLGWMT